MQPRTEHRATVPDLYRAVAGILMEREGIRPSRLLHLGVKLRASQINDARSASIPTSRTLCGWSDPQRCISVRLARVLPSSTVGTVPRWNGPKSVTLVAQTGVLDAAFRYARFAPLSETEIA